MPATIEEFEVWKKAESLSEAINAILPKIRSSRIRDQLSEAADSMLANMSEGFEQPTDRALARYLYTSKGSVAEARHWLRVSHARHYISKEEMTTRVALGIEVGKMLAKWIGYLLTTDRKDRGVPRDRGR